MKEHCCVYLRHYTSTNAQNWYPNCTKTRWAEGMWCRALKQLLHNQCDLSKLKICYIPLQFRAFKQFPIAFKIKSKHMACHALALASSVTCLLLMPYLLSIPKHTAVFLDIILTVHDVASSSFPANSSLTIRSVK